jgi:quercetin dioxygenase-like cupin family protein
MRLRIFGALVLASGLLLCAVPRAAVADTAQPTIVLPDQLHWVPGTGPMAGVEVAVLVGDPTKAGPYTIRLRLPDGAKFAPHFHDDVERVTVISGTMLVGVGNTMAESTMTTLPAGSFVSIPAKVPHYAVAKGITVIQIGGNGPMTMTAAAQGK